MPSVRVASLQLRAQAIVDGAERAGRDLTAAEAKNFRDTLADLARARADEENVSAPGSTVRVNSEPGVYRPDIREFSFLGDVVRSAAGHADAAQRLARYQAEQRAINTTVGSGGAYVPPAYLEKEAIEFRRFSRVLADLMNPKPLPDGTMTINIPKMATGTAVATQASQNSAATETDFTDEFITQNVTTLAGQQTVSIQFIERSPVPVEDMVFADLKAALDQQIDDLVISALASNGTAVAYTSTTPTAAALIPILGQAKADVATGSAKRPANAIVMTPSRWEWMATTGVDSSGRPLVVPNGNLFNAFGAYSGIMDANPVPVGSLTGLPVYTDGNIPADLGTGTNQDEIFVVHRQSHWLMESPVMVRALPQTLGNQLSILLQVYAYVAFFGNRYPDATGVVGGTGLVSPVF